MTELERMAKELAENTRMTTRIYNALFIGDPETQTLSLFRRVADLEAARGEKQINRAMVAIGTVIGSAIGAVTAVYSFFGGSHRQ